MKRCALVFGMALALPLLAAEPATDSAQSAVPTAPVSLSQAFETAWQRVPAAHALGSRQSQARAQLELAGAWTPAPPKVSLGELSDRLSERNGRREWEAEVAVPLWLPGQRGAQLSIAQTQQALLDAQTSAQRLELAANVREAWWKLAAAGNTAALARGRLNSALLLQADVERRFEAGDLARTDANIARTETQAAEGELIDAMREERQTQLGWLALTGMPVPSSLPEEVPAPANTDPESNPRLQALASLARTLRARVRSLDSSRRESPEVSLRVSREQSSSSERLSNAVGIKLTIPLSSAPRNARDGAELGAELAEAETQAIQVRRQLQLDVDSARGEFAATERRLTLVQARVALAADTLQLMQRSFALGETDLATLLRARAGAFDADAERDRQRIARAVAVSHLNQALGVLP